MYSRSVLYLNNLHFINDWKFLRSELVFFLCETFRAHSQVVFFFSFVIGLVFLVALRFLVGCAWTSRGNEQFVGFNRPADRLMPNCNCVDLCLCPKVHSQM